MATDLISSFLRGDLEPSSSPLSLEASLLLPHLFILYSFASCTLKTKPPYWPSVPRLFLFSFQEGNLNLLFYFFTPTAQLTKRKLHLHTLEMLLKSPSWQLISKFNEHTSLLDPVVALNFLGISFLFGILSSHCPTTLDLQIHLVLPTITIPFQGGFVLLCFVLHLFSLYNQMLLFRALSLVLFWSYKISWENESVPTVLYYYFFS